MHIIVPSINHLENVRIFKPSILKHNHKILVIDEGDQKTRKKNRSILEDVNYFFYGPRERRAWFKQRFGSSYRKYFAVIPDKCHAETSFGFLVAFEEKPDIIIELDDDVFPVQGYDLIDHHASNLFDNNGVTIQSEGKWYNVMENLHLNTEEKVFPRGHPYAHETKTEHYTWNSNGHQCVLNEGLWIGHPDLDAPTILYHGGLDGRCMIEGRNLKREKVVLSKDTYFTVCSMNTSFVPTIIPAFYQLHMNYLGLDRFDDIWSGIFLKKVADNLNAKTCLGRPLVRHNKRPRDLFKDLRSELEGIALNEILWRIVDSLEIDGNDYWTLYQSLIESLKKSLSKFREKLHSDFIKMQLEKMELWTEIVDMTA